MKMTRGKTLTAAADQGLRRSTDTSVKCKPSNSMSIYGFVYFMVCATINPQPWHLDFYPVLHGVTPRLPPVSRLLIFFLEIVEPIKIVFLVNQLIRGFDFLDQPRNNRANVNTIFVHLLFVCPVNNQDRIVVNQKP